MLAYRIETIVPQDRMLTIRSVPFRPGEKVEVIVLGKTRRQDEGKRYPLRGKPIRYIRPLDSVAENEWMVLQ